MADKEYIEREALKSLLHQDDFDTPDERWRPESEFAVMIDAIPAADVAEVRYGRWKGAGMGDYYCSLCNTTFSGGNKYKFCPECGADMR